LSVFYNMSHKGYEVSNQMSGQPPGCSTFLLYQKTFSFE
jgi:hypothetical protein